MAQNRYLGKAIRKNNQFGWMLDSPELFHKNEDGKLLLVRESKVSKKKKQDAIIEVENVVSNP